MPPRLLATDLDGTLLRSDGTISPRTLEALAKAESAGLEVVFVTARPPRWIGHLAEAVGAHGIVLCGNGAFVLDVAEGRVLAERCFAPAPLAELVTDLRAVVPGILLAGECADGMVRDPGFGVDPDDAPGTAQDVATRAGVGKLLGRHPELSSRVLHERVAEVVGPRAELAFSGAIGLAEMTAPGVTKAAGLADWCHRRGVEAADVIACGDMPNDLPMLRWAGHAVAVANAHADVLAIADEITVHHEDDGVARVLERLVGSIA